MDPLHVDARTRRSQRRLFPLYAGIRLMPSPARCRQGTGMLFLLLDTGVVFPSCLSAVQPVDAVFPEALEELL